MLGEKGGLVSNILNFVGHSKSKRGEKNQNEVFKKIQNRFNM